MTEIQPPQSPVKPSWRCVVGIHRWPAWSSVYSGSGRIGGKHYEGLKMQERYCQDCHLRESRIAI